MLCGPWAADAAHSMPVVARLRAPGTAFPQVTFSKSNNTLCVSVARANGARPRIETFLSSQQRLLCKQPSPPSPKTGCLTQPKRAKRFFLKISETMVRAKPIRIAPLCTPGAHLHGRRNYFSTRDRNSDDDPKNGMCAGKNPHSTRSASRRVFSPSFAELRESRVAFRWD